MSAQRGAAGDQALADLLGPTFLDDLGRPTGEALGLPGAAYCSEAFYRLERETLFPRVWVAAAMAHEVPGPGDVLPVEVAGWPLVFVRDRAGEVRCFHNICRHRAMAVVPEPASDLRSLRCPWHGWTYALDGSLRGTPEFAGPGTHDPAGFDRARCALVSVRVEQWFDYLFVNLDGGAPPLGEHLRPLLERFAHFDLCHFRHTASWTSRYPGNWKIAMEGGIEDYHLCWLHPDITENAKRGDESVVEVGDGCFFGAYEVWDRWSGGRGAKDLPPLPSLPGLEGKDARTLFFLNIFPTGVLGITADHLYAGVWLPDGADSTVLSMHHYFVGEGADAPALEASRGKVMETLRRVFEQDESVVREVHRRAAVRDALGIRTRFSPFWETGVHAFQRLVIDTMRRDRPAG